ncbi:diguanylate cyclase [Corallincola platygyrae]|uniref:diguanylate cyclase n=1 Tax=Corallincola platygyrae TaxID=1193278 RepID=A0ABW4XMQ8_9GAMM
MPFKKDPLQPTLRKILAPYFWPILLVVLVVFSSASAYNYFSQRTQITEQRIDAFADSIAKSLRHTELELLKALQNIEESAELLVKSEQLTDYLEAPDSLNRFELGREWAQLAKASGHYKRLQLLDLNGLEIIKIDYDSHKGIASVADIAENSLPAVTDSAVKRVAKSDSPITIFDLERKEGQLKSPYKLAGTTLAPVYQKGTQKGFAVLSLQMDKLNQLFSSQLDSQRLPLKLLTSSGHFIRSENPDYRYGHIFADRQQYNLAELSPQLWQEVSNHNQGTMLLDGDLFAFRWIELGASVEMMTPASQRVLLLSHLPEEIVAQATKPQIEAMNRAWIARATFILLLSLGLALLARYVITRLKVQNLMLTAMCQMSAVMILDEKGTVIGINRAFESLSGFSADDICGQKPRMLMQENMSRAAWKKKVTDMLESAGAWQGEVKCQIADETNLTLWMEISAIETSNRQANYFVASFIDMTERIEREEGLKLLATKDPLTGIDNRRTFDNTLCELNKTASRYPSASFCLALLDLDYFKQVNDVYGHATGDNILKNFAKLVSSQLREQDLFARIGGEEFALIMPFTSIDEAEIVCDRIRSSTKSMTLDPKITVSVGLACHQLKDSTKTLFDRADRALYHAKALGRNQVVTDQWIDALYKTSSSELAFA